MSSLSYCCLSCHVRGYWHRTCFCCIIIRFLAGNSLVWSAVVAASSHVACPLACRAGSVNGPFVCRLPGKRREEVAVSLWLSFFPRRCLQYFPQWKCDIVWTMTYGYGGPVDCCICLMVGVISGLRLPTHGLLLKVGNATEPSVFPLFVCNVMPIECRNRPPILRPILVV